ncbi:hypothetical protein PIB30_075513 [Stylosanthes scabra]|uniref:Uncharacterized protein n=1 Tax=Stylosanthes scabra TaxID=79078 RepID=A0ABU6VRU9_9FABA|nr:hypothetical protein [Stylosanthes scabra]
MGKYTHYAVRVGKVPGTLYTTSTTGVCASHSSRWRLSGRTKRGNLVRGCMSLKRISGGSAIGNAKQVKLWHILRFVKLVMRKLPTIVEDEVSVMDNQILGYLEDLKKGQCQPDSNDHCTFGPTGKAIEALEGKPYKVSAPIFKLKLVLVAGKGYTRTLLTKFVLLLYGLCVQKKLEFVTFSWNDIDILYMIKQTHAVSPFAFWSHN